MKRLVSFVPVMPSAQKRDALRQYAAENGLDPNDVDKGLDHDLRGDWFGNDLYVVIRNDVPARDGWPAMIWLSIRRQDRAAIRDWRHFQQIKNELVGAECEAVEMYPAESRLVDTANQYHLWCLTDPEARWPFGFDQRLVTDAAHGSGAKQRARGQADG